MSDSERIDRGARWGPAIDRRAVALWPRLDPRALRRCRHDPRRIAALVARRTSLSVDAIHSLLVMPSVTDDDGAIWFG